MTLLYMAKLVAMSLEASLVPRGVREWCSAFPKRVHENDQDSSPNHENPVLVRL
jgi:hypothetical protein